MVVKGNSGSHRKSRDYTPESTQDKQQTDRFVSSVESVDEWLTEAPQAR